MFFRYLQLRHALNSQFPRLHPQPWITIFSGYNGRSGCLKTYLLVLQPPHVTSCHFPGLSTEISVRDRPGWCDRQGLGGGVSYLQICRSVSPKLSDRLTHLFILHRSYLTLTRLSRYRPDHSPACHSCGDTRGAFYYLLWSCPSIQGYMRSNKVPIRQVTAHAFPFQSLQDKVAVSPPLKSFYCGQFCVFTHMILPRFYSNFQWFAFLLFFSMLFLPMCCWADKKMQIMAKSQQTLHAFLQLLH